MLKRKDDQGPPQDEDDQERPQDKIAAAAAGSAPKTLGDVSPEQYTGDGDPGASPDTAPRGTATWEVPGRSEEPVPPFSPGTHG